MKFATMSTLNNMYIVLLVSTLLIQSVGGNFYRTATVLHNANDLSSKTLKTLSTPESQRTLRRIASERDAKLPWQMNMLDKAFKINRNNAPDNLDDYDGNGTPTQSLQQKLRENYKFINSAIKAVSFAFLKVTTFVQSHRRVFVFSLQAVFGTLIGTFHLIYIPYYCTNNLIIAIVIAVKVWR